MYSSVDLLAAPDLPLLVEEVAAALVAPYRRRVEQPSGQIDLDLGVQAREDPIEIALREAS